jgi:hypothetical protein
LSAAQHLRLEECGKLTDEELTVIAANCTGLKSVVLHGCYLVTEGGLGMCGVSTISHTTNELAFLILSAFDRTMPWSFGPHCRNVDNG